LWPCAFVGANEDTPALAGDLLARAGIAAVWSRRPGKVGEKTEHAVVQGGLVVLRPSFGTGRWVGGLNGRYARRLLTFQAAGWALVGRVARGGGCRGRLGTVRGRNLRGGRRRLAGRGDVGRRGG